MPDANVPLLRKVLEHITAHPEEHNQFTWALQRPGCGTAFCVAGHAVVMSGRDVAWEPPLRWGGAWMAHETTDGRPIMEVAQELLGLGDCAAFRLFRGKNSLEDIWCIAEEITGGEIKATEGRQS